MNSSSKYDQAVEWLTGRYGPDIGPWLARRLAAVVRRIDDPCMSHFRVCDLADAQEVSDYNDIVASGCCGSVDQEFHHYKTDRKFMVGFNFGH